MRGQMRRNNRSAGRPASNNNNKWYVYSNTDNYHRRLHLWQVIAVASDQVYKVTRLLSQWQRGLDFCCLPSSATSRLLATAAQRLLLKAKGQWHRSRDFAFLKPRRYESKALVPRAFEGQNHANCYHLHSNTEKVGAPWLLLIIILTLAG